MPWGCQEFDQSHVHIARNGSEDVPIAVQFQYHCPRQANLVLPFGKRRAEVDVYVPQSICQDREDYRGLKSAWEGGYTAVT